MIASPSPRLFAAAARLRVATLVCAVLVVLVTVTAVLAPYLGAGAWLPILQTDGLPRAWAATIALAVAASLAVGLVSISQMLACTAHGEMFSVRAVSYFRRFALCLLLAALLQMLLPIVAALLLAWLHPAGAVVLSVDAGDVLVLLLAIVFYFVSRLLVEASRLDEDNRSIV